MADRLNSIGRLAVLLAIASAILIATWIGYRHFTERYTATVEDSGVAVARVVAGRLYGGSELRVSRLSGVVQATAATSRMWGWLKSSRIVKAPFEVDYFVDLRTLDTGDFRYDPQRRTLLVEVPDVVIGRPNVDEGRVTLDRTDGVYVSRDAMAELQQRASETATRVVAAKAQEAENMRRARDHGRAALERLFAGTLAAAGLPVTVEVRFRGEPRPSNRAQWDVTRSLEEVLGTSR